MPNPYDRIAISEAELAPFNPDSNPSAQALALLEQQKQSWELLRMGYRSLKSVRTRVFDFDGFQIKVQFNPGRMTSTAAKVDPHSIRERKCFLCPENLPAAQRGIAYDSGRMAHVGHGARSPAVADGEFLLLCNPFPIFPEHFTLPCTRHLPQRIEGSFEIFLEFTRQLGDEFSVFYNGPKCGASAPDHLHFQAGNRAFIPIDTEFDSIKKKPALRLFADEKIQVLAVENCLRHFIAFESADILPLRRAFETFYKLLGEGRAEGDEPMLNILGFYEKGTWRILCFPRTKHRPGFYFKEGPDQLLISPAAVELGGVCTTPREIDFEKVTREHLIEMFNEVCISDEQFRILRTRLTEGLKAGRPGSPGS